MRATITRGKKTHSAIIVEVVVGIMVPEIHAKFHNQPFIMYSLPPLPMYCNTAVYKLTSKASYD